jgi:hypothetical protein
MRHLIVALIFALPLFATAKPPGPIKFIENKNQWSKGTHYVARVAGGTMEVSGGRFQYTFLDQRQIEEVHHFDRPLDLTESGTPMIDGVRIDVSFVGSNEASIPTGLSKSKEYYNYFVGDQSKWAAEAHAYEGFYYPHLYHGVDLKVYSVGEDLKYDLLVKPGADPSVISIEYAGADDIELENGDIRITTKLVTITEKYPYAFQVINGVRKRVACEFRLDGNRISFEFPEGFDPCHELVIDPKLIFSTYIGSASDSWGSTATPAENANMYSSGVVNHFVTQLQNGQPVNVFSGNFPASAGAFQTSYGGFWDIGIIKYDSLGQNVLFASYLGGGDAEFPHSLVVNKDNELVIMGTTSSTNFPTSANAHQRFLSDTQAAPTVQHVIPYSNGSDIFLARISGDGTQLLASTYLGGTSLDGLSIDSSPLVKNYGDQLRGDVITDSDNFIYVSSVSSSANLTAMNAYKGGQSDAIVVKMTPDLSQVVWLRRLGGQGVDAAYTIKLDDNNDIFVAGATTSTDLEVTGGAYQSSNAGQVDGWITKLSNDGLTILASTYAGSAGDDPIYFLDLNLDGEVYVYGQTDGSRPISSPDLYGDPNSGQFIQKLTADLSQQLLYTVFGSGRGEPDISPTAFLVNDCDNIYATGWGGDLNLRVDFPFNTNTSDLKVTNDAYQRDTNGHDFYMIVLSANAQDRLYATFLGGESTSTHVDGGTSRFDKRGVVYHAVCASCGGGQDDFKTTPGVVSRTNNSLNCNNAAFKFDLSTLKAVGRIKGSEYVCIPDAAQFENLSIGGERFRWNFGDGTVVEHTVATNVTHEYKSPGTYTVWLKAIDPGTCRTADSISLKVYVALAQAVFPNDATICEGTSHTLTASGGVAYEWFTKDGSFNSDNKSITVTPVDSTLYFINVYEQFGCVSRDSIWVHVIPKIVPEMTVERFADCSEKIPVLKVTNLTDSLWATDQMYIDFGDGTTTDVAEVEHEYAEPGKYTVKVVVSREFCVTETAAPVAVGQLKFPNVITPQIKDGKNDTFAIQFGDDPSMTPDQEGFDVDLVIYDRWGRQVYSNEHYQSDWSGSDLVNGVYYYHATVEEHSACKGWVHLIK